VPDILPLPTGLSRPPPTPHIQTAQPTTTSSPRQSAGPRDLQLD